MDLLKDLIRQTEKVDFQFPNSFKELMNSDYYDYDKFEWFLYYVFKLDGHNVKKNGKKGKGDGGADLILTSKLDNGGIRRIGIQAKYWKNRVGSGPINQLASAKDRHSLTDLWIITTSDLTDDAKEIAEAMDIKILRKKDVEMFIEKVKEKYKRDIKEMGESSIAFLIIKNKKPPIKHSSNRDSKKEEDSGIVKAFKKFRLELSKKYKLYPVYTVFNNDVMMRLIKERPVDILGLSKVKGLGTKKIETFGKDIISFIQNNLSESKSMRPPKTEQKNTKTDENLLKYLLDKRVQIAKYNDMKEEDVFSYKVADYITRMKPVNKSELKKIYGFRKQNIDIFGDYLVKSISEYIKKKK